MFSDKTTENKQLFGKEICLPNCMITFCENKNANANFANFAISLFGERKNKFYGLNFFVYVKYIDVYDILNRNYLFTINIKQSMELWMVEQSKWAVLSCYVAQPRGTTKEWMLLTEPDHENYKTIKKAYEICLFLEKLEKSDIIGEYEIYSHENRYKQKFAEKFNIYI